MKRLENLVKSKSDKRLYLYKELPNKFKCLLISDPETDKSAASVNVNVGNLVDPSEYLGLAHFLEHMLFMGTEKYPGENDFSEFLNLNSGSSNAYTDFDSTNYHFDVSNEKFEQALDRFSYFFIAPLFQQSGVEKEINAVESEHKKNLQTDYWRFDQLLLNEAHPNSPFCKFGTGSLETLNKPGIREALIDFHAKYYSANIMSLVILSDKSLEAIENLVDYMFSKVKNFDFPIPNYNEPKPYYKDNLGYFYHLVPVNDMNELRFYWFLDDLSRQYKHLSIDYFCNLFSNKGPNSLASSLIKDDLALNVDSYNQFMAKSHSRFYIEIKLTNKGLKQWETVAMRVIYFLKKIQTLPINKRFYEEIRQVNKIKFDFKNKEEPIEYCSDMAINFTKYENEDLLTGGYLMDDFNETLIRKVRDILTIENANIYLVSQNFADKDSFLTEQWYGTRYKKERIPEVLIKFYQYCDINEKLCDYTIDYPPENNFIPKNLDVLPQSEELPNFPQQILKNEFSEVWYKQDNKFLLPKADVRINIYFKKDFLSFKNYDVYSSVFFKMVKNEFREIRNMARNAYLFSKFYLMDDCLYIKLEGFNSSLKTFIIELFKLFRNFSSEGKLNTFQSQVDKLIKKSKNFYYSSSSSQASRYLDILLNDPSIEHSEKITILENNTNMEEINKFLQNYFNNMRFSWLIEGNVSMNEALEMTESVYQIMKKEILKEEDVQVIRLANIPVNNNYYYILPNKNPDDENSAVITYYQFGKLNYEEVCCAKVLENIFRDRFFDDLRTNQQLGYITGMYYSLKRKIHGFECMVQGSVKSPEYVKSRIHLFFNNAYELIKNISDENFKENVDSVIVEQGKKDLSLSDECYRNYQEIRKREYNFNINQTLVKILEKLEKGRVISFFEEHFVRNRRILDIEILAKNHVEENQIYEIENKESLGKENIKRIKVRTPIDFRRRVSLFPDFYTAN